MVKPKIIKGHNQWHLVDAAGKPLHTFVFREDAEFALRQQETIGQLVQWRNDLQRKLELIQVKVNHLMGIGESD